MATRAAPTIAPTKLNRHYKVVVTEVWTTMELRKVWQQLYGSQRPLPEGEREYGYVEEVLPATQSRTVLETQVEGLNVERVVCAVYGMAD